MFTPEQRIAINNRTINRALSTLVRATKPEHIKAAHARIDRAETNLQVINNEQ